MRAVSGSFGPGRFDRRESIVACAVLLIVFSLQGPATLAQTAPEDAAPDGSVLIPASPGTAPNAQETAAGNASPEVLAPEASQEYVGEMYQIGLGWHPSALEGLPTDKYGLVDWVAALESGLIAPRGSIEEGAPEGVPFDMNIVMPSKTGMIAGAYFPHKTHTIWLGCESCHVKIFLPMAGSNDLTMSTIVEGDACGVCHGKVAFPLNDCTRCHVPEVSTTSASTSEP